MQISSLSISKDRTGRVAGDDSVLILPGICGVFDGASSGTKYKGASPGQLASRAAAAVMAELAAGRSLQRMTAEEILSAISHRISQAADQLPGSGHPSTTMAAAWLEGEEFRILIVGDSGVRINGNEVFRHLKRIDDVSTATRIAVFNLLKSRGGSPDEVEAFARRISFSGLDWSVSNTVLTQEEADGICDTISGRFAGDVDPKETSAFLRSGIQSQYLYANRKGHPFGYSVLNAEPATLDDVIDLRRPAREIETIEFFTDGYFNLPSRVSLRAWEDAFAASEAADFHKTNVFPNIKGSTSTEFADDRSVIVVSSN